MRLQWLYVLMVTALVSCPGDTTPPTVPSNLTATPGDAQVALSWSANAESDLKGYTLAWGTSSANLSNTQFVSKPGTAFTVMGLQNNTAYFFALSAEDTNGNASARSAAVSGTPIAPPPPPPPVPPPPPPPPGTGVFGTSLWGTATFGP
jgi:chitodextrinase